MQITKVTFTDQEYPDRLRELASPPKQLFVLGKMPTGVCVTIVGTRHYSSYGEEVTYKIATELAQAGVIIISGLAYGIDGIAHRAALEAGGTTVAILAGGIEDRSVVAGHRELAKRIVNNGGGLISEYELGITPLKHHFPARNRIASGLSQAVIVTEAGEGSGALITANFALNQNKIVMAVPGNITNIGSAGTNNLIRSGAIPVTSAQDVLAALDLTTSDYKSAAQPKSKDEARILDLLGQGHNTSEALIKASELDASQFANVITLMEITGKVRNLGAGNWVAK